MPLFSALTLTLCAACAQQETPRAAGTDGTPDQGAFERISVLTVDGPTDVALADLDGDGHTDAVVAAAGLHILLNDGTGDLREAGVVDGGPNPAGIAVGDANGDGIPDLAVANHDTEYVTVLLGDGEGGFRTAPGSPIVAPVAPHPHAVLLADLDGDGHQDLLVDDRSGHAVVVLPGAGDGSFGLPGTSIPVGGDPYRGMVLADVNGDGRPDLLAPIERAVAVRLAEGDGGLAFTEAASVPSPGPFSIGVADLTGDGALDIVTGSENQPFVHVYPGDGAGGFGAALDSVAIARSEGVAVGTGDVDGDGVEDAVITSYTSPTIVIILGGTPIRRATVEATQNPWGLAVGDVDGDGRADAVIADEGAGRVYLFRARPPG